VGRAFAMNDCFISIPINETRNICLAPISMEDHLEAGCCELGDSFGVFIYETSAENAGAGIRIIGKLSSVEAAEKLAALLEVAYRALGLNRPIERYLPTTDQ
jgi:hypothetical protein